MKGKLNHKIESFTNIVGNKVLNFKKAKLKWKGEIYDIEVLDDGGFEINTEDKKIIEDFKFKLNFSKTFSKNERCFINSNLKFFNDDIKTLYIRVENKTQLSDKIKMLENNKINMSDFMKKVEQINKEKKQKKESKKTSDNNIKVTHTFDNSDSNYIKKKEKKKKELITDINELENKIKNNKYLIKTKKDILTQLIKTINDYKNNNESNGYYFWVSKKNKTFDEKTIKSMVDNFKKLFQPVEFDANKLLNDGHFIIKIFDKDKKIIDFSKTEDNYLLKTIKVIDNKGKIVIKDKEILYGGDLSYGDVKNSLLSLGFEELDEDENKELIDNLNSINKEKEKEEYNADN